MIEELNDFFKALIARYNKSDFVIEVTITDDAAALIPHVSPKIGESIDIFCAMGRVRLTNGGEKYQKLGNLTTIRPMEVEARPPVPSEIDLKELESLRLVEKYEEEKTPSYDKIIQAAKHAIRTDPNLRRQTVAGYPYVITSISGEHRYGEVELPNGQIVEAVWDKDGKDLRGRPKFEIGA